MSTELATAPGLGVQPVIPLTLEAVYGEHFDPSTIDIVESWLSSRSAGKTKLAYAGDVKLFFGDAYSAAAVREFLMWPPQKIAWALQLHKNTMRENGMGEKSINRRLSAMRSLMKFAFRLGASTTDGRNLVDSERVETYSDTEGITLPQVGLLLAAPAKKYKIKKKSDAWPTVALRDVAILRLFCSNGLRCNEVHLLDVEDFHAFDHYITVLGKGRGSQKTRIDIDHATALAIEAYRRAAGHDTGPLFRNVDRNPNTAGARITNRAIYRLVNTYGLLIGIPDLHPHSLRHTAITLTLLDNNGNIPEGLEFSRHKNANTLMIYNRNAQGTQRKITNRLATLFDQATPDLEPAPRRGRPKKTAAA